MATSRVPLPYEEARKAPFPPGCKVLCFDENGVQVGVVKNVLVSISFPGGGGTFDSYYEVEMKGLSFDQAAPTSIYEHHNLRYTPDSPVEVSPEYFGSVFDFARDGGKIEGTVIGSFEMPLSQCSRCQRKTNTVEERKFFYSVRVRFHGIKEAVEAHGVPPMHVRLITEMLDDDFEDTVLIGPPFDGGMEQGGRDSLSKKSSLRVNTSDRSLDSRVRPPLSNSSRKQMMDDDFSTGGSSGIIDYGPPRSTRGGSESISSKSQGRSRPPTPDGGSKYRSSSATRSGRNMTSDSYNQVRESQNDPYIVDTMYDDMGYQKGHDQNIPKYHYDDEMEMIPPEKSPYSRHNDAPLRNRNPGNDLRGESPRSNHYNFDREHAIDNGTLKNAQQAFENAQKAFSRFESPKRENNSYYENMNPDYEQPNSARNYGSPTKQKSNMLAIQQREEPIQPLSSRGRSSNPSSAFSPRSPSPARYESSPMRGTLNGNVKIPDEGCYLLFSPSNGGRLILHYSRSKIQDAIGFWWASNGVKIQNFKFQNGGTSDLIKGLGSSEGKKKYYSGWCQYVKTAWKSKGVVVKWPNNGGIEVDLFVFYVDTCEIKEIKDGEPFDCSDISAVACVPKGCITFKGVNTGEFGSFLNRGNSSGTSISMEGN